MKRKLDQPGGAPWKQSLAKYIKDPQDHPDIVVKHTADFVIIKDMYPKSKIHQLLMPTRTKISSMWELCKLDLPLLNILKRAAQETKDLHPSFNIKIGFHAVPSMSTLHLHMIGNDLTGDYLKTKAHYKSFTTPFFIELEDILECMNSNDDLFARFGMGTNSSLELSELNSRYHELLKGKPNRLMIRQSFQCQLS